jgi:signal transduction histidine kinase
MPYLLGLSLELPQRRGALLFVRFGGPEYTPGQLPLASMAAVLVARVFERRSLAENQAQLELARYRAQLQDDFIATISHELHTPLGFIKGYTTSLLRSDTTWDEATQREFLSIIDEESDHLVELIDRMLDSARLESGSMPMDFQPVRLDSLLRDIVQRVHSRHKSLEVELELVNAPPIQADSVRLTQVINNLFDNALKYAPGAKITISLQCHEHRQVVTFSDEGPGIPPEHLQFLFERFYRVPGQSGKHGTGLGLFICRQIIQAHHGQISVKTTPGKGTAFHIELPVRQANPK